MRIGGSGSPGITSVPRLPLTKTFGKSENLLASPENFRNLTIAN